MRKAFIEVLRKELASGSDVAVFLGDISVAGFLDANDQLVRGAYNCGILEQAMVSFAAGASSAGIYPVVQTIVPFLVERAFEQIKLDFCAQGNPGLLVGVGGGLEYSKLGYTHQTLWDTALLANLEGLTLFTPTFGPQEVREALKHIVGSRILAYARLTETYLKCEFPSGFALFELSKIKQSPPADKHKAIILCGSFPGIQAIYENTGSDVFVYSFPNRLPTNLSMLEAYEEVLIWEFGTAPILARTIKSALPDAPIRSRIQAPRFFRAYGEAEVARFIDSNWICLD